MLSASPPLFVLVLCSNLYNIALEVEHTRHKFLRLLYWSISQFVYIIIIMSALPDYSIRENSIVYTYLLYEYVVLSTVL